MRDGKSCAILAIDKKETVTIIHEYLPTERQALDTCTPILDDGNVFMTVSSIRDLTTLNELNSELDEEKCLWQRYERELEELHKQLNLDSHITARSKK